MKSLRIVFLSVLIAGCSHGQVQFNGGAVSTTSGGTAINSSSPGLNVQGNGASAATLIGLGIAGAVIYRSENSGYGTRYDPSSFMAISGSERAPELAPMRKVNEQDCTLPIEDPSANLKCR